MIFLETNSTDPFYNLAFEEFVFTRMDPGKQYFFLWQNANTIVVGKYQNTAEEINRKFVEEHGIKVVRRLTGGGAVYHDTGNLNYTFIVDHEEGGKADFSVLVQPVIKTLAQLGVKAELTGRNDLTIDGKKFSGNSQHISKGRLLHHGCIMLDSNLANVANALKVSEAKFESKSVKSVRSRVTTINENAPEPIGMDQFKAVLKNYIMQTEGLEEGRLSEDQLKEVRRLRDEKYATWEWNYGSSPSYNMKKECKFDAGLVTVHLQSEGERIKHVKFYGDFFGNGDLSELEHALEGTALNHELKAALDNIDVDWYMRGISARDLYELLVY